jgi:hypothetical protein
VSSYNITITPHDNPRIQTTVSVEVDHSGGAVRVTEMTVRATEGAGLSGTRLPVVDVELLLQAILPSTDGRDAPANGRARISPASGGTARARGGRATTAATETGGRAKRATGGRRDPKRTGTTDRRRTAESKAGSSDMRAYRRMPDDLAETYGTLKNITALAGHYGVPRHTAQGWMNRLRKQTASA